MNYAIRNMWITIRRICRQRKRPGQTVSWGMPIRVFRCPKTQVSKVLHGAVTHPIDEGPIVISYELVILLFPRYTRVRESKGTENK